MGEWSGHVQYHSKIFWFLYFKWQRQSCWVLDSFGLQCYSLAWNSWYPHPVCYSSQWIWIFNTPRKSSFRCPIFCSGTLEFIDQSWLSFFTFWFWHSKSLAGSPLSTWNIGQKHIFLINCKDLKMLELILNSKIGINLCVNLLSVNSLCL